MRPKRRRKTRRRHLWLVGRMVPLYVDVRSVSKPVRLEGRDRYRCEAEIRVTEGGREKVTRARLTVCHPRGWMGVFAGFVYELDTRRYPTFERRAEWARQRVLDEFPDDRLISVFLLGTGSV
ncbi:MAG: hypothetical protein KQH83_11185 [Actinobacteria bacterium]|nr:hypothetical protein [Actinomycetota bacterium]